jgi:natural product precursor
MKKIGKISINPEKVIKNEELVNLRGGYGNGTCGAKSPSGSPEFDS